MLVLSRKVGEEILIDGHISVQVVHCGNGRVRLGITAPRDVEVMRAEIAFDGQRRDRVPNRTMDIEVPA